MATRRPVVAGSFYPSKSSEIKHFCKSHFVSSVETVRARAVVLPHAGYIYSGKTACLTLSRVDIPKRILMMGPNHHGLGADFALFAKGIWQTPLGNVEIDKVWGERILRGAEGILVDETAHLDEHSLEVIVPMLQAKRSDIQILPLTIGCTHLEKVRDVALSLGSVLAAEEDPFLIVVSNDMSHFDNDATTRQKDRYALEAIQNLDAEALVQAVKQYHITMCGFVPVYMLLLMAKSVGIHRSILVDYRTSADATGDKNRVVGYAGFIFE